MRHVEASDAAYYRFIDETGAAIAYADIRLLCFEQVDDFTIQVGDDVTFQTNGLGHPIPHVAEDCSHVAAMHLHHIQPSGKPGHGPAYWVYSTSWSPRDTQPHPVTGSSGLTITIPSTQSLVLFNVVTSLAWKPASTNNYVTKLWEGLEKASAYLYDVTDGNMAFGPVAIHAKGAHWQGADIRILPANDFRPSAHIGGIVPEPLVYTSTIDTINGIITKTAEYTSGAIFLGRNWTVSPPTPITADRVTVHGATDVPADGAWDMDGSYRTIIHEWLHYAVFLYDEYQTPQGQEVHCTTSDNLTNGSYDMNGSVMDWHYTASELWHPADPPPMPPAVANCEQTKQFAFHGLSDCETLAKWYEIQDLPNRNSLPPLQCASLAHEHYGPSTLGLTKYLFGRTTRTIPTFRYYLPQIYRAPSVHTSAHGNPSAPTTIDAQVRVDADVIGGNLSTQVYVLHGGDRLNPDQILYQGQVVTDVQQIGHLGGHITLLGVQEQIDHVHIFGESYTKVNPPAVGGQLFGHANAYPNAHVRLKPTAWQATMDATYKMNTASQLISLTVVLSVPITNPLTKTPVAQLCNPDANIRCHADWHQPMIMTPSPAISGAEVWTATFTPLPGQPELPRFGIVRVRAHDDPEESNEELASHELIRWYKTSGVGPGSHNAHTPSPASEDDLLTLYSPHRIEGCDQVVFMPAANYNALTHSLGVDNSGKPILGILGHPTDIAVNLPDLDHKCSNSFGLGSQNVIQPDIVMTIFYNHPIAPNRDQGVDDFSKIEDNLRVLYFDPTRGWRVIDPVVQKQNKEMNSIAIPFKQDGIYAIGWVAGP